MLDNKIEDELKRQKILPILNTTELKNDIYKLKSFLAKNPNVKYIEITLRRKNSFEIAHELKNNFLL